MAELGNILILSPGRRVDIVQFFVKEFSTRGIGKVFTADMSRYAPALYVGDEYFILEKDFNNLDVYIDDVISLCLKKDIKFLITLIDPELLLLAHNIEKFSRHGITVIISDKTIIEKTFDKYDFFCSFKNKLPVIPTYNSYSEVKSAFKSGGLQYPVFKKLRTGSGSAGIGKICTPSDLNLYMDNIDYIIQPYVLNKEFGVDVYFDLVSGNIVSLFIKEKIAMRAGETDKAISVYRQDIVDEILKLKNFGFKGPIDVDVFEDKDGNLYINEINPRFGGGYPHAYAAGVDFINLLVNNFQGLRNDITIGNYTKDLVMMKYNGLMFKTKETFTTMNGGGGYYYLIKISLSSIITVFDSAVRESIFIEKENGYAVPA